MLYKPKQQGVTRRVGIEIQPSDRVSSPTVSTIDQKRGSKAQINTNCLHLKRLLVSVLKKPLNSSYGIK